MADGKAAPQQGEEEQTKCPDSRADAGFGGGAEVGMVFFLLFVVVRAGEAECEDSARVSASIGPVR